jgi:hypothetical protein
MAIRRECKLLFAFPIRSLAVSCSTVRGDVGDDGNVGDDGDVDVSACRTEKPKTEN